MKKNIQKLINKYNEARRIYIESKTLRGTKVSDIENIYLKYEIHYSDISDYENSQLEIVTEDDKLEIDSLEKEVAILNRAITAQHKVMKLSYEKLESEAIWHVEYLTTIPKDTVLTDVHISDNSVVKIRHTETGFIYTEEINERMFDNVLSFETEWFELKPIKPIAYKLLNLKTKTIVTSIAK